MLQPLCNYKFTANGPKTLLNILRHESGTNTWINFDSPLDERSSSFHNIALISRDVKVEFTPRTALGEKLLKLRMRAIASGMQLLTEEEILEEVKRRRGELEDGEEDLS